MFDPCVGKPVFIYFLWCPIARRVRYVGKTLYPERRIRDHINAAMRGETSHNAACWIRKLRTQGLKPRLRIARRLDTSEPWPEIERAIIAKAISKKWPLTNQCEGGNNPVFLSSEHAADARNRKAESVRKSWSDPTVRQKRSDAIRAAWADPERRSRIQSAQKKAANSPKRRSELVAASRLALTTEREANRIAAVKAYWADPDNRRRHSENTSRRMRAKYAKITSTNDHP